MSQPAQTIRLVKKQNRDKMPSRTPAKADVQEEIKRISDLLLTLSQRVRQLDEALTTK